MRQLYILNQISTLSTNLICVLYGELNKSVKGHRLDLCITLTSSSVFTPSTTLLLLVLQCNCPPDNHSLHHSVTVLEFHLMTTT